MFSQASVKYSVLRRWRVWQRGVHGGGTFVAGGMHNVGRVWMAGACAAVGGAYVAGETATAADGTHPTGMHSCYK